MEINQLKEKAKNLRLKVLDLSLETKEAHLGGCFSEIEILIALYDEILKKEDKFILSKGHCSHPLYLLLRERGYTPKISIHPDIDIENGIYCTTGSLGHGLPIGVGMAMARKIQKKEGLIYVLMGDGECQEGTTWESVLIASKHRLNNLRVIIDYNKVQALDKLEDVLPLENLAAKFRAFNCDVSEIDGHSFTEIISAFNMNYEKPGVIIANTIKGKGVSYMEGNPEWHGRKATPERLKEAYRELRE
jgi:transketolase